MSYEPTVWNVGDTIAVAKLNRLEQGVAEMSSGYTPTVWVDGDEITAQKMNRLEQAVASGGGGGSSDYPTITATYDDTTQDYVYTCDWTFSEIKTKIETSAQESNAWAGIYIDAGYDGTIGGTWNITDVEGAPLLQLILADSSTLVYDSNGNIEFVG